MRPVGRILYQTQPRFTECVLVQLSCPQCVLAQARFESAPFASAEAAAMTTQSGDSIVSLVLSFADVSRNLSSSDRHVAARLCEAGKAFLQERARRVVAEACGHAVLLSYSSDGTPLSTKERFTAKVGGRTLCGKVVRARNFCARRLS